MTPSSQVVNERELEYVPHSSAPARMTKKALSECAGELVTCMLERRISPFIKGVVLAVIKKNIRKPRAGSERNRQRLMEFAKAAFAEKGTSASLDDIAHAAGFGVGTLYRHFPTREVLTGQLYEKGSLRAFAVEFHDLLPHPEIEKSISVPKLALQYAMATGVHFHVVVSRTQ